ncbi:MAG: hypothetical protein WAS05_00785 [Candidatus Nanopelagicales bacterium]
MIPFGTHTVEILTAGTMTERGQTVKDWSVEPSKVAVSGCSVEDLTGAEDLVNRFGHKDVLLLKLPPATVLSTSNRVKFRGSVWLVSDIRLANDVPGLEHKRCMLVRWEG